MAKVTIEDISQLTGLSRGTISRALNDRPDISALTKTRVLEACARLNYVPSPAARSLATGRHYSIAVIVDDLHSPFAAAFLRGVIGRAERSHYTTTVVELPADPAAAANRLRSIGTERLDGVLVAARIAPELGEIMCESSAARTVASCWPIAGLSCDVLTPDLEESGRLAMAHALSGGTNVLHVDGERDAAAELRRSGAAAAGRDAGLNLDEVFVQLPENRVSLSRELDGLRERLLSANAIVAGDDHLAIGLMLWLARHGRHVGENVAVIGQGNTAAARHPAIELTSVDFGGEEIGQRAADVVIQRLGKTRQDVVQTTNIAPQLQRRRSSASLP